MFIIIAILIFGFLIAIHELGHFAAAKSFGVKVNEFNIGMGPRLWKKQRGETLYSLKLLPFGGSCVMEGEDSEVKSSDSDGQPVFDPRAFTSQSRPKRAVILSAGAFMNLLAGMVIILILVMLRNYDTSPIGANTIANVFSGSAYEDVIRPGDRIYSIDGKRVYYYNDFYMLTELSIMRGDSRVDLELIRDGNRVKLNNLELIEKKFTLTNGEVFEGYGFQFSRIDVDFGEKLKYAFYETYNDVRSVWLGLEMLITGNAGLKDMSGPVGIVDVINDVGSPTTENAAGEIVSVPLSVRLSNVFSIAALIAINLAVVNLLPIPALDGGRIFGLIVTWIIEKISRRRIDPKYEGYVHAAGLVLLLGLTAVILVSDILKIAK